MPILSYLSNLGMGGGLAVTPPPEIITDGFGGGAGIVYKRPHKKIHDEIEEYFDLRTPAEAEKAVDEIAEAALAAVHAKAARSGIAALLNEQRNAELRALLALAQDEDDAEAVLVMLELS